MSSTSIIDDYLAHLTYPERVVIEHFYDIVRQMLPTVTEELSYGMPAFKYQGKGLVAIMANKHFLSLYPFGSIEGLGVDASAFEQTTGSIHFSLSKPIPDDLFKAIIQARKRQIVQ